MRKLELWLKLKTRSRPQDLLHLHRVYSENFVPFVLLSPKIARCRMTTEVSSQFINLTCRFSRVIASPLTEGFESYRRTRTCTFTIRPYHAHGKPNSVAPNTVAPKCSLREIALGGRPIRRPGSRCTMWSPPSFVTRNAGNLAQCHRTKSGFLARKSKCSRAQNRLGLLGLGHINKKKLSLT